MSTVLVTGGAGFIGSHLADRLLAEGHRVISVDDLTTGRIANLVEARGYGKEFTFFNMDVRAEGLLPLFERHRPEVVFHLAAQSGVRPSLEDPVHDASINIMGTLNVLECAAKVQTRKVIYAASGGTIYGEPRATPGEGVGGPGLAPARVPTASRRRSCWTTSGSTSATAGWTSRRSRWPTCTARARTRNGEAGVVAIFANRMIANEPVTIFGDGNQTRDFVFVDDVVHAFVQAIERGSGKLVNIGTGLESSVNGRLPDAGRDHRLRRRSPSTGRCRRGSCAGSRWTSPPPPPPWPGSRGRTWRTGSRRRSPSSRASSGAPPFSNEGSSTVAVANRYVIRYD